MPDVVFCPNRADAFDEFIHYDSGALDAWTSKVSAQQGDVYLFWFGDQVLQINGIGVCLGEVDPQDNSDNRYKWTSAKKVFFADFEPFVLLEHPIVLSDLKADPVLRAWWATKPYQGRPKTMLKHPAAVRRLLELISKRNANARKLVREQLALLDGRAAARSRVRGAEGRAQVISKLLKGLDLKDQERLVEFVKRAKREKKLRGEALQAWGAACVACGRHLRRNSLQECEVAHVRPVSEKGFDAVSNAMPLCRTHHWAFDNHLWAPRPNMVMEVYAPDSDALSPEERKSRRELRAQLHGKRLRGSIWGTPANNILAGRHVQWRWDAFLEKRKTT